LRSILDRLGATPVLNDLVVLLNGGVVEGGVYQPWIAKLLMAKHGTDDQVEHYDFKVADKEENIQAYQWPMSLLAALHGDATYLTMHVEYKSSEDNGVKTHYIHKIKVPLNPGDLILWTGYMVHAGGAYDRINIRLFSYLPTSTCTPSDEIVLSEYVDTDTDKWIVKSD
jgi:hypothetical protein